MIIQARHNSDGMGMGNGSNFSDVDEIIKQHLLEEEKVASREQSPTRRRAAIVKKRKKKARLQNADLSNLSPDEG